MVCCLRMYLTWGIFFFRFFAPHEAEIKRRSSFVTYELFACGDARINVVKICCNRYTHLRVVNCILYNVSWWCCSTNRKVAGSIPAGVIEIFPWYRILPIALWPWVDSDCDRNEYQEYFLFLGVKSSRCIRLITYHHPVPLSWYLGTLTSWNILGLCRPVTGLLYLLLCFVIVRGYFIPYDV